MPHALARPEFALLLFLLLVLGIAELEGHPYLAAPMARIKRIEDSGKQGRAFAQNSELADYLETQLDDRPTLVVFFSNGSFDGVIDRFAKFALSSP